jgi:hypothetical protein
MVKETKFFRKAKKAERMARAISEAEVIHQAWRR